MNCWKTINLSRDLGDRRIAIFSFLVALASFIIMYLSLSIINDSIPLNDDRIFLFIISLFIVTPLHNVSYAIPAWLTFKKAKIQIIRNPYVVLYFTIKYIDSIPKSLKILSILAPTFFITIPLIICALIYPSYMHYFTMTTAVNIGLSVVDFIYLTVLIRAPKKCYIDHYNQSFDILIKG
ncbi:DUF3267 domain-containing protein [Calidifontibacillus oryziterrae]|uniref:DUF3267 domain-containing protein n=1 Tax=Calidifontibacillus oryziterrae TaxID=1191699 RepID=UPI0002D4FE30|nr:DUF3267 domain-containing protein [Calidifontibacillus oryziterrae]